MNWRQILDRQAGWTIDAAQSLRLTNDEAIELYSNAPFHELMKAAHLRRKIMHPEGFVTYLVDRNINYTNVCTIN